MRKRILSACMALCLMLTMLPVNALAADPTTTGDIGKNQATYSVGGLNITKTLTKEDGNLSLQLEAYVTGTVTPIETKPLDIVLVLDVSGSMDNTFTSETRYTYDLITGQSNRYIWWDSDNLYTLLEDGETYVPVEMSREPEYMDSYEEAVDWRDRNWTNETCYNYSDRYALYYYDSESGEYQTVTVERERTSLRNYQYTYFVDGDVIYTSGEDASSDRLPDWITFFVRQRSETYTYIYSYTGSDGQIVTVNAGGEDAVPSPADGEGTLNLYLRESDQVRTTKLQAMKDAVNAFIDEVSSSNGDHEIAVVKFADDSYAYDYPRGNDTEFAPGETWTFTYTYTVTAEDVIAGSVSNTVTAESGNGDESTDEVTVPAGSITITPADITIYTGGNGYSTVVDENGETVDESETQGLPEPGYYIDLPEALNTALLGVVAETDITENENGTQVIDLSGYLKFTYDDGTNHRVWTLERYDKNEDNKSMAYNRYIYRLVPAEDQVNVRLQFTGEDGVATDDLFILEESNLYQTYNMTIYPGVLDQAKVRAVITIPNDIITDETKEDAEAISGKEHNSSVKSGILTVRGITNTKGEATTTEIVETAPESEVNNVTALIDTDTKLYINESSLEVADTDSVELLVDSVVSTAVQDLKDSAVEQVDAITNGHEAQFYYLDLVDTDNGNTVVTTKNEPVTLFFPYPEGTDADTAFHIVHYVNQDRDESAKDEIADVNEGSEKFAIEVYSEENQNLETTDQGIQITVTSFSPFGLFWEEDSGSSGGHTGGGGSSRPSRPTLNTEDHYSYIIGYSDGTLQPYGTITRGEVATIFFRLLTDDSREEWWSQVNDYSDCNSDLWCNNAISTLSNMGIIDGFSDGTFRPYAKITRAQFAKIAVGFFETTREDYQGYFTDVDIDAWYTEYVEAAARVGLIEGFNDGTFRPNTNITRAQACVIVNRALGRAPDEDRLLDEDEMITWPDNNPDDWFYADMQEATNSHDYTWTTVSGDKVENWTDKLPQRDWAALEHAWSTAHSAPGGEVTE